MIEIQNLSKTYSNSGEPVKALENVSLTINDGEIFGIIGLSGAGKSTLVRCINLLEKPTEGRVLLDGQDLTGLSEKELLKVRRGIGMIFQGFNLLEQRTVLKNVCFPLEIAGEHVDFEIDPIAHLQVAQRRYRGGVGDDVEAEMDAAIRLVCHRVDC